MRLLETRPFVERQFGVPVGEGAGVPPGAFAEGQELGTEDDLVLKKKEKKTRINLVIECER